MMNRLFAIILLAGVLFVNFSCSDEIKDPAEDDNQIRLSGTLTKADGEVYPGLNFIAFKDATLSDVYIGQTPITIPAGLYENTSNDVIFTNGTPYYPLGNNEIRLFAYTGNLENNRYINLTSGRALTNDFLLSNQGYREGETTISTEGEGTPGSSTQPAEILQFRHLMTRVNVEIEVNPNGIPEPVSPVPSSIQFRLNGVYASGRYDISRLAPVEGDESNAYVAEETSGSYTLRKGVNYLVPTGADLTQLAFTRLIIDDYTATTADLAALSITPDGSPASTLLVPGYAYTITFEINELGIQGIRLTLEEWEAREITNEEISYDHYTLTLELGDYASEGDDAIVKAVLHTSLGELYVGAQGDNGYEMNFVTLPITADIDSVGLFTNLGLLITLKPDDYVYAEDGSVLRMYLSSGGMKLQDPTLPPSPENPYLITTPVQVFNMEKELTASYKQINDIDVDRLNYDINNPVRPLSIFEGTYDGNGYRVQNLVMIGSGLLQRNEGTIKNLHISSGLIDTDGAAVAGPVCAVNAGTLIACVNEARVIGATNIAGGICGINEPTGIVIGCVNTGNIEDGNILGGICGSNEAMGTNTFAACVNIGLMSKDADVIGGILGQTVNTGDILIKNSFWLVGTAAYQFGGSEVPVGSGDAGHEEVAALSPERLRNDLSDGEDLSMSTLVLLNESLEETGWGNEFEFVLDQMTTGSVWPMPEKKQ